MTLLCMSPGTVSIENRDSARGEAANQLRKRSLLRRVNRKPSAVHLNREVTSIRTQDPELVVSYPTYSISLSRDVVMLSNYHSLPHLTVERQYPSLETTQVKHRVLYFSTNISGDEV